MDSAVVYDELKAKLADVGIDTGDVASMRFDVVRRGDPTSPMVLVVVVFAKDENGKRYIDRTPDDGAAPRAATEVRRLYLSSIGFFAPAHNSW